MTFFDLDDPDSTFLPFDNAFSGGLLGALLRNDSERIGAESGKVKRILKEYGSDIIMAFVMA